ncbi:hypothetical protein [Ramlibacter sp. 2FC]|uniref:hypothetical protein n=1 Tax=Ramlibacter sp. 2FC TaxID=2502188 RepID=UPI0010F69E8B|nr:hypothetical protein [Ramlibacter sp. 2FC]
MTEEADTIVVFTARSAERIVREGGSQSWVLNAARAKNCTWLVCTQNRHNADHEFSDATEPHGTAFLLGKISGIRKSREEGDEDRWQIAISEFARINVPDAWDHGRNPVRYTLLKDLRIDPAKARWQPMPTVESAPAPAPGTSAVAPARILTIAEAKKALAATFGVKPDAIEITIRG